MRMTFLNKERNYSGQLLRFGARRTGDIDPSTSSGQVFPTAARIAFVAVPLRPRRLDFQRTAAGSGSRALLATTLRKPTRVVTKEKASSSVCSIKLPWRPATRGNVKTQRKCSPSTRRDVLVRQCSCVFSPARSLPNHTRFPCPRPPACSAGIRRPHRP